MGKMEWLFTLLATAAVAVFGWFFKRTVWGEMTTMKEDYGKRIGSINRELQSVQEIMKLMQTKEGCTISQTACQRLLCQKIDGIQADMGGKLDLLLQQQSHFMERLDKHIDK